MNKKYLGHDDYVRIAKNVIAFLSKYEVTYMDVEQIFRCARHVMFAQRLQSETD